MKAIRQAMPLVQTWYNQQLGGRTFQLNQPVVDTLHGEHYGYEYGTTSTELLNRLAEEVYRKAAAQINLNEQVILLFYPLGIAGAFGVGNASQQDGIYRRIGVIGSEACQSLTQPTAGGRAWAYEQPHTNWVMPWVWFIRWRLEG